MIVFIDTLEEVRLYKTLSAAFDNETHFGYAKIIDTETGDVYDYTDLGELERKFKATTIE